MKKFIKVSMVGDQNTQEPPMLCARTERRLLELKQCAGKRIAFILREFLPLRSGTDGDMRLPDGKEDDKKLNQWSQVATFNYQKQSGCNDHYYWQVVD